MSPSQVLFILWRRSWIVGLTFLAAVAVAIVALLVIPKSYDAVATANMEPGRSDPLGEVGAANMMLGYRQGNLIALVESERVAQAVVRQLNYTADPALQAAFRESEGFGREPIENWIAGQLLPNVDARFGVGTFNTTIGTGNAGLNANVLNIKYRSRSPNEAAVIANAFLSATIDASIAMKVEAGEQTSRWFQPRIEALRSELEAARASLRQYQQNAGMSPVVAGGADTENSKLTSVTDQLLTAKALLTVLETRLASGAIDLSPDAGDPDSALIANMTSRLTELRTEANLEKTQLGANNPKVIANLASIESLQKQRDEALTKMREHLRERIENTKLQIATLEQGRDAAVHDMIHVQGQRDKLAELQRQVQFKEDLLDSEQKAEAQADLQSKLTFSDITVLDKATPPTKASFPKAGIILPAALAGGLALGLVLALIAEAIDRRVRFPEDLVYATSAPALGVVTFRRAPRSRLRIARPAPAE